MDKPTAAQLAELSPNDVNAFMTLFQLESQRRSTLASTPGQVSDLATAFIRAGGSAAELKTCIDDAAASL